MKHKDHNRIVDKFDEAKHAQLERLATKMLKQDDKFKKLKEKNLDESGIFKLFENGD